MNWKKNNLLLRSISGMVYVALIVAALKADFFLASYLFALFLGLCVMEVLRQVYRQHWRAWVEGGLMFILFKYAAGSMHTPSGKTGVYLVLLGIIILMFGFFYFKTTVRRQSEALGMMVYLFSGMYCLLQIGHDPYLPDSFNGQRVLFIFILIWSSDTFAYLSGRAFGKRALAPGISPNKTIEGLLGGTLCTLLISFTGTWFFPEAAWWQWMLLALITVAASTLGDLFQSKWKREYGIKDSGNLLPGHGGFFDRLDSAFLAGPAVYVFLYLSAL